MKTLYKQEVPLNINRKFLVNQTFLNTCLFQRFKQQKAAYAKHLQLFITKIQIKYLFHKPLINLRS